MKPSSGPRRLRLVTVLLAAFAVVGIVPLVLSHLRLIRINREALETAEKQYLTRGAVDTAESIANYIRTMRIQIRKIGDGLRLAAALSPEKDPFAFIGPSGLLQDHLRSEPSIMVLRVLDKNQQGSEIKPASGVEAVVEAELQRVFTAAVRGAGSEVTGQFLRTSMFPDGGIVLASPVRGVGSDVAGVVEAFVSLAPVRDMLVQEGKRDVSAYLIDRNGELLLASDPAISGGTEAGSNELVSEFIQHPVRLTTSYMRGEGSNARRVLGTVSPIGPAPDLPDWGVIVEKEEARAFAAVTQMTRESTLGAGLALLLAVLAAVVAAGALSRPVLELVAKVRLVAEGNFSERVPVRGTRELAELSATFNFMSGEIEKSIEKLKLAAKENQELFLNSIKSLAAAIDAKDPYTRGHSERVARYSVTLARHMGLPQDDVRRIRIGALLHDVGKIGIDDRILRKPTALTDEEFEVMKTHPVKGALIMGQIPQLKEVIPGMKYHHEKWDGGGYPEGLAREEIPLIARIVSVADTFDAMTTTRPYQKAMQLDYVVGRIKSFSGSRFDPAVVEALEEAFVAHDLDVAIEAGKLPVHA